MSRKKSDSSLSKRRPSPRHGPAAIVREHLDGPDFLEGAVLRIFLDADAERTAERVSELVAAASREAEVRGIPVGVIVLPAGAGILPPIRVEGRWWTEEARLATQGEAEAWAQKLGRALGPNHPPIVAGLDRQAEFLHRKGKRTCWEQLIVRVQPDSSPHVTWKCTPVGANEENFLYIPWSSERGAPAEGAVARNGAVGSVGSRTALFLVCHDGTAFARTRWLPRAKPDSWRLVVRRQYAEEISRHRPAIAFNLIHSLPGNPDSSRIPPPFLNGHRNLAEGRLPLPKGRIEIPPVPVIAVSGLNPACRLDPFEAVAGRLPCPYRRLDVRLAGEAS